MFGRALRYLGIAAVGSVAIGVGVGVARSVSSRSRGDASVRARRLAGGLSEAMNACAFSFLVGAPIAVLLAYVRSRR